MLTSMRYIVGAIAIGFCMFVVLVVALTMILPADDFSEFMRWGGIVWLVLAILSYPISRLILR